MSERTIDSEGNISYRNERGHLHREDGPAYVRYDGLEECWFRHGFLHRRGGPAITTYSLVNGQHKANLQYYENGKRHRVDGPAIAVWDYVRSKVSMSWYLFGIFCENEERHKQLCFEKGLLTIQLFEEE